jgi:hypothetical protein
VRRWVRTLDFSGTGALAQVALELDSAAAVAELMLPVAELLGETADAAAEGVEGGVGVVAVGRQA